MARINHERSMPSNRQYSSTSWDNSYKIASREVYSLRDKNYHDPAKLTPPTEKQKTYLKALRQVCLMHGIKYPKDEGANVNQVRFGRLIIETNKALCHISTKREDLAKVYESMERAKKNVAVK